MIRKRQKEDEKELLKTNDIKSFFEYYHPHCPILPHISTFLGYSDACPLLFYTVLVIPLRGKSEHTELFFTLVDSVRTMSYDSMKPEHVSLQYMQAFLLLCCWPLPYSKRTEDPSHSFIAVATHMGYRLGLHRPSHYAKMFEAKVSMDENMRNLRRITWVSCFITNVSVTSQLGLPTTIRFDRGLLEILTTKPHWLPDTLYYQLHTTRHAFNISSALEDCEPISKESLHSDPIPVVRVFDTELRDLESRFSSSWSSSDYIFFLGCRMMLYTLALTAVSDSLESQDSNSRIGVESPSHWVIQSYLTAMATIRTAASMRDKLFASTTRLHRLLMNAVCFLLLLKSSKHQDLITSSTVASGISQGWEMLRGVSITAGDFTSRACLIIERMSRHAESLQPEDRTQGLLVLKSRMGANVALSTAVRARELSRKAQDDTVPTDHDQSEEPIDVPNLEDPNLFMDINWEDLFLDMGA